MFYKCLDCGAEIVDPDLCTWRCCICGSEHFTTADKSGPSANFQLEVGSGLGEFATPIASPEKSLIL